MSPSPPWIAERLLSLAIRDTSWREGIVGDLSEEFSVMSEDLGVSQARRWYWREAMSVAAHRVTRRFRRGGLPRERRLRPEAEKPRAGLAGIMWHDLRSAWRMLRHQPALSATVVIVLAVALAANATTFALADAIVLRPFRFTGVDRAVVIASDDHKRFFDRDSVAAGDLIDWREQARDVVDRLAAIDSWDPTYSKAGPIQRLSAFRVSPALFEVLGASALLGRTLLPSDERRDTPAVVLGYEFWQRQFAGRADVLNVALRLDGVSHRVVGVMPPTFRVPYGADLWGTLSLAPDARSQRGRGSLIVVGRLAPGVDVEAAEQRLKAILAQQKRTFHETHERREVSVRSFTEGFGDPGAGPFMIMWQMAAFLLLLVACANVANLMLARNVEREREFAVRLAVGASSLRISWQLLVEGVVLAAAAAMLALPLIWAALGATRAAFPPAILRFIPGVDYLEIAPRTFLATALLAGAATVLFAMAPAWRAGRQSVSAGLRHGGRLTSDGKRQYGRAVLATVQIALTLALLATAGASLSALYRVTEGPLGFDQHGVLVGRLSLSEDRYQDPERRRQFVDRVLARLAALPPVTGAAVFSHPPYGQSNRSSSFWPERVAPRAADATQVMWRAVTPTALSLLRIRLVNGRMVEATDRPDGPPVALVSESLARRFWPTTDAIGQRFRLAADGPLITVVGVVGDVAHHWLFGERMTVYRPLAQDPPSWFAIMVRTVVNPAELSADLRMAVQAEDDNQPLYDVRTLSNMVETPRSGSGSPAGRSALLRSCRACFRR
jgi:putative ABC transport system permease protein